MTYEKFFNLYSIAVCRDLEAHMGDFCQNGCTADALDVRVSRVTKQTTAHFLNQRNITDDKVKGFMQVYRTVICNDLIAGLAPCIQNGCAEAVLHAELDRLTKEARARFKDEHIPNITGDKNFLKTQI